MTARQFDIFGGDVDALTVGEPEPVVRERVSPDRARTLRQADDVRAGRHPLTGGPLHPGAPDDATNRDLPGLRCGGCALRRPVHGGSRDFPKCHASGGLRITRGAASDVRAWWPACPRFTRTDFIPEVTP